MNEAQGNRPQPAQEQAGCDGNPQWQRLTAGSWQTRAGANAAAIILGFSALVLVWLFARPLALVLLGIAIAMSLVSVVAWLNQYLPRLLAVIIPYLLLLIILVALAVFLVPRAIDELLGLVEQVPAIIERITAWLDRRGVGLSNLTGDLSSQLSSVATEIVSVPLVLGSAIVDIGLIIFISVYWLSELPQIRGFFLSLYPAGRREKVAGVLEDMGSSMGGWVRGTVIDGLIIAVLSYIGLTIIGVPYALALSAFAGVMEFIPMAGPVIAAVPILLVALFTSPTTALITLAFILVLQQIESNILLPNVMHSQTDLRPLLGLLAFVFGAAVGGLLGALVAIPLTAALQVFVARVVAPAIRQRTGAAACDELADDVDAGEAPGETESQEQE